MKAIPLLFPAIPFVIILASTLAAQPAPLPEPTESVSPQQAFESLKKLAGTWESVTEGQKDKSEIRYRVIAGGSVLLETLMPGTDHEMATVYYLDGPALVLVHYCAARNQPHMRYSGMSKNSEYVFDFAGGTNLDPAKDGHMHNLRIRMDAPDRVATEWDFFKQGKMTETMKFALVRKP